MTQADSLRLESSSSGALTHLISRSSSIVLATISLLLFASVLVVSSNDQAVSLNLLVAITLMLAAVVTLHTRFLMHLRSQQRKISSEFELTVHDKSETERKLLAHRAVAKSASSEARALRVTTLTLTTNGQLDQVLDRSLESLSELVPYESACVLLLEDHSRLLVARENCVREKQELSQTEFPVTWDLASFSLLKRILKEQNSVLLADVNEGTERREFFTAMVDTRSWLCVPLIAADRSLGLLCAEHSRVNVFTREHLRLTRSLAVSVAAAIQNARLYEQTRIYGAELEKRVCDLQLTQRALEQTEKQRLVSEEKFHGVFRSSPVALLITTLKEGRIVDANPAFEQRYDFSRSELIDRTVFELNFWENRSDQTLMMTQLNNGKPVSNLITRLRTKSGEFKLTAYSASKIRFDGEACVLAVSADIPHIEPIQMN